MRNIQSMQVGEVQGLSKLQPKPEGTTPQNQATSSEEGVSQGRPWVASAETANHAKPVAEQPRSVYEAVKTGWNWGVSRAKAKAHRWREQRAESADDTAPASDGTTVRDRAHNVKNDLKKVWAHLRNG